jgi:hypothetical protein
VRGSRRAASSGLVGKWLRGAGATATATGCAGTAGTGASGAQATTRNTASTGSAGRVWSMGTRAREP